MSNDAATFKVFEMKDRLQELVHIANTAAVYAKCISDEANYPRFGNYTDPKVWIGDELFPFFQTVRFRLTEIHKMLDSTFDRCLEGCGLLDEEEEEHEPTPEELAEEARRQEQNQKEEARSDALYRIRFYAGEGPENLDAIVKFSKALQTAPEVVSAKVEEMPAEQKEA